MLEELFLRIVTALDRSALPYMIIGGQAVLLYGEPRLTKDIDITLGVGIDRLHNVLEAARTAGLAPLVDPELFTRQTMVLPCADPQSGMRVDFILSFSPFERMAISRARRNSVRRCMHSTTRFAPSHEPSYPSFQDIRNVASGCSIVPVYR